MTFSRRDRAGGDGRDTPDCRGRDQASRYSLRLDAGPERRPQDLERPVER